METIDKEGIIQISDVYIEGGSPEVSKAKIAQFKSDHTMESGPAAGDQHQTNSEYLKPQEDEENDNVDSIAKRARSKRESGISFDDAVVEINVEAQRIADNPDEKPESDSGRDSSNLEENETIEHRCNTTYVDPEVIIRPSTEKECDLELIAPVIKYYQNTPVRMRPPKARPSLRNTVAEFPGYEYDRSVPRDRHRSMNPLFEYNLRMRDVQAYYPDVTHQRHSYLSSVPVRHSALMLSQEPEYQSVHLAPVVDRPQVVPPQKSLISCEPQEVEMSSESSSTCQSVNEIPRVKMIVKLRTAILILAFFAMGTCSELPDLLLHALSYHVDATYEQLTRTYAANGGAMFLGAIATGLATSYCHGNFDFILAACLALMACCTVVIPWCKEYLYFLAVCVGMGMSAGVMFIVSMSWLRNHWPLEKASIFIHLLFVALSVAGLVSCQITGPFLHKSSSFISLRDFFQEIGLAWELRFISSDVQRNTYNMMQHINGELAAVNSSVAVGGNRTVGGSSNVSQSVFYNVHNYNRMNLPAIVVPLLSLTVLCTLLALIFICICCYKCSKSIYRPSKKREEATMKKKLGQESSHLLNDNGYVRLAVQPNDYGEPLPTTLDGQVDKLHLFPLQTDYEEKGNSPLGNNQMETTSAVKKRRVTFPEEERDKPEWFQDGRHFDLQILMYLYVFFTFCMAMETIYSKFLFPYVALAKMKMDVHNGTLLLTTFWGAMTAGRIIMIPLSRVLSTNTIMIHCLSVSVLSPIMMFTIGHIFTQVVWIFTGLAGLSLGPIFAGGFTWANTVLTFSPKALTLAFCFMALGRCLFSWFAGVLLDFFGHNALMYLAITTSCLSFIAYFPILIRLDRGNKRKKKPVTDKPSPSSSPTLVSYV